MPAKVIEPGPVHHGYNDLFSTLLRACAKDDIAVVISLLEAGVGVDEQVVEDAEEGGTPLMVACRHGRARVVDVLLRYGATPDAPSIWRVTGSRFTPLMMTAMYGHPACARLLLDKGHPIDGEVRGGRFDGEGALNFALKAHVAAHLTPANREGARDVAMQLLDRSRASDPAGFSERHVSDLFQCMCVGTGTLHTDDDPLPAIELLLAARIDPNTRWSLGALSPAITAAAIDEGRISTDALRQVGKHSAYPLEYALAHGVSSRIIEALLKAGADPTHAIPLVKQAVADALARGDSGIGAGDQGGTARMIEDALLALRHAGQRVEVMELRTRPELVGQRGLVLSTKCWQGIGRLAIRLDAERKPLAMRVDALRFLPADAPPVPPPLGRQRGPANGSPSDSPPASPTTALSPSGSPMQVVDPDGAVSGATSGAVLGVADVVPPPEGSPVTVQQRPLIRAGAGGRYRGGGGPEPSGGSSATQAAAP